MRFLRSGMIWLVTMVCVSSATLLMYVLTLNTTVMDRQVVKTWLSDSNIYANNPLGTLLQPSNKPTPPETNSSKQLNVSTDAVKTALAGTFTADFLKTHTESTIDNAYDWLEGKSATFSASIPINQQRDTYIQQLAKAIEPQVATLPTCTQELIRSQTACRPANLSVAQLANQLTIQGVDQDGMFSKPLQLSSQAQANTPVSTTGINPLNTLPITYQAIRMLVIILPLALLISLAIITLSTATDRRAQVLSQVSRRIFFGVIATFLLALALGFVARGGDLGLGSAILPGTPAAAGAFAPLIKIVVTSLATQLAIYSGIVCVLSAAGWLGLRHWNRQQIRDNALDSVAPVTANDLPPTTPPPGL